MATYKNKVVLNYPAFEIFKVFKNTAKRDFPKFDEKCAVGTSVERIVGAYSVNSTKMKIKITEYKPNELYEIESIQDSIIYKSRYEFRELNKNATELLIVESMSSKGTWNFINIMIASIVFRGRVRKRLDFFVKGLKEQINQNMKKTQKCEVQVVNQYS